MIETGCLHCKNKQDSYSWSGADIDVTKEIFPDGHMVIVELLEEPYNPQRYLGEQVLQCRRCNSVWYLDYRYTDRPPLSVNANRITDAALQEFFTKIGQKLGERYTRS